MVETRAITVFVISFKLITDPLIILISLVVDIKNRKVISYCVIYQFIAIDSGKNEYLLPGLSALLIDKAIQKLSKRQIQQ